MRGRRRRSSSTDAQNHTRMALRKQVTKDVNNIPSGDQDQDEALDDSDNTEELSSSLLLSLSTREKSRQEREHKPRPKEMTEEEMMDLALRLSKQEASVTALRLQKEEEEDVMKAIQESMNNQTQLCPPSQSQSLITNAKTSLRICTRRKFLYSNGKQASAINQGALEDSCTPEMDLNRGANQCGSEGKKNKKRKKKEGSPLLEMPDLSQTQKIHSQASPGGSEVLDLAADSPQSSDSTQIDDCQLRKSPVFPSISGRAEVRVPRLSKDVLETCRTSGSVSCSQDSWTLSAHPKSPIFPKSSSDLTFRKSPVFSEMDHGDSGENELSPEYCRSPVFGSNTQHRKSLSPCKPQVSDCNSGITLSSQESLTSSVTSASCRPQSPVFPRSPSPPKNLPAPERSATCKNPDSSGTDGGQTEQSPVFGRSGRPHKRLLSQDLRTDSQTGNNQPVRVNQSSQSGRAEEKLRVASKDQDSAVMELTSNMTLEWSDEDDDITSVGSPSPVFLEERPAHQADGQPAPLNHGPTASPQPSGSNCRSTGRWHHSTAEQHPVSRQGMVSGVGDPAACRSTVHYYWGVPFCPQGLDPDSYTQVILAQMEVYEKSLKQAQRCLLRKAEWGEAILPQAENSLPSESPAESHQELFPQRRGIRLRSRKQGDTADPPPAEAEEDEEDNKGGEGEEEREGRKEEKRTEEEEQVDSDDCEVCPETQLSDNDADRTQDLILVTDSRAEMPSNSSETPDVEIIQSGSPAAVELQEEEEEEEEIEVDVFVDRKMAGSSHQVAVEEVKADPDVVEMKHRGLRRSASPELELAVQPQIPQSSVDCPICQGSFPVTEIEIHAAYCDGELAISNRRTTNTDSFRVSPKPRRKRARRAEVADEQGNDPSGITRNQEKCYICQTAVPLRDYSRHTELCIQRQESKSAAKQNLLSALDKTDNRDSEARPSGSKLQSGDVIDLQNDDDEDDKDDGGISTIRISNSPIRSFTPISEAADCLIDFRKRHRSKKLSQKRR